MPRLYVSFIVNTDATSSLYRSYCLYEYTYCVHRCQLSIAFLGQRKQLQPTFVIDNSESQEVVKTSDRSIHEEGNTTPDEIVIATREADSLGVNSRFQIAAEAVIAQCEAVVAQKAMKKAAKIASMTVEAAKEAGECMASDEFLGFTQAEKGKELEFVLAIEIRG